MVAKKNNSLPALTLLKLLSFAGLVFLSTSCELDTKTKELDSSQSKDTILNEAASGETTQTPKAPEAIPEPKISKFVNFISAESRSANTKTIKYFPAGKNVDWQVFIVDSLKPKTASNPSGQDTSNMHFGDFGWNTIISRSPNALLTDDTSAYYAIDRDKLVRLKIDSLEAEITYYKNGAVTFTGNFLGYSNSPVEFISFLIQTNVKDISNQVRFTKIEENQIRVQTANKAPEEYDIILHWNDVNYTGPTDESEIILDETGILSIESFGNYLITSWMDDGIGQQCDRMFKIYHLENGQLKLMLSNHYNCDI